jgi:hypothetical protein
MRNMHAHASIRNFLISGELTVWRLRPSMNIDRALSDPSKPT